MRVLADREKCCGAGMCALTAPSVFDQDQEEGRVVLLTDSPEPGERAAVREATHLCPAAAIWVEE